MEFPVDEFMAKQEHELASRIQTYQAMSNNVSAIGHPCTRYLVYKRTRGDEGTPISTDLQSLFDEGNSQEVTTTQRIQNLGYRYERGQESFGWPEYQIRGKIDGVAIKVVDGKVVGKWAAEIKKVMSYTWEKLNVWQDLFDSHWHYRWLVQLQLAIHHVATKPGFDDAGVIFLKNSDKNLIKPIAVPKQESIIREAFEKAKTINEHMMLKTEPDRIDYTLGICKGCEFSSICCPDEQFMAGENIQSKDFIEKLKTRERLYRGAKEYERLDKDIKEVLRGKQFAVAGPFRISGKESGRGWKVEIERIMTDDAMDAIESAANQPKPIDKRFAKFQSLIIEAKTKRALDEIKSFFQEEHALNPFEINQVQELRDVFKKQYTKVE